MLALGDVCVASRGTKTTHTPPRDGTAVGVGPSSLTGLSLETLSGERVQARPGVAGRGAGPQGAPSQVPRRVATRRVGADLPGTLPPRGSDRYVDIGSNISVFVQINPTVTRDPPAAVRACEDCLARLVEVVTSVGSAVSWKVCAFLLETVAVDPGQPLVGTCPLVGRSGSAGTALPVRGAGLS